MLSILFASCQSTRKNIFAVETSDYLESDNVIIVAFNLGICIAQFQTLSKFFI